MQDDISPKKHLILLAEDDEVSQEIVRALLQGEDDIELTVAGDGKTALEEALRTRFDLLIFDQNLPFITGDRVIRHLRAASTKNSDTPILRFSASIAAPAVRETHGYKESVLPKPLSGDIFVSTVRALLDGQ